MLKDGQNLNFAVPAIYVRELLDSKVTVDKVPADVAGNMTKIRMSSAALKTDTYSDDDSSQYQQDLKLLKSTVTATVPVVADERDLRDLACIGTDRYDLSKDGIAAAKKLVTLRPSPEARALLAYTLYDGSGYEFVASEFAADGSAEKTHATNNRESLLAEAEKEALKATSGGKGNSFFLASYVLGSVKEARGEYASAIPLFTTAVSQNTEVCGDSLLPKAYRNLIDDNSKLKRPADAEKWFRRLATEFDPTPYDWDSEGDRRASVEDSAGAADAYERAANGQDYFSYDYCYAASARYFQPMTDQDATLKDGRKCVDAAAKSTSKSDEHHFTSQLPLVYRLMAIVLNERGVYQEALAYAKESLSRKPEDAFSLSTQAEILENLQRYSECVASEQAAIAASDGKYAFMHFRLGSCYFDQEDWSRAETSFRLAANGATNDAPAAYDLALCLSRQGYKNDAASWFKEALKRKPDTALRELILGQLNRQ
jgi:tetratricopeptide (TPR) repeat protein